MLSNRGDLLGVGLNQLEHVREILSPPGGELQFDQSRQAGVPQQRSRRADATGVRNGRRGRPGESPRPSALGKNVDIDARVAMQQLGPSSGRDLQHLETGETGRLQKLVHPRGWQDDVDVLSYPSHITVITLDLGVDSALSEISAWGYSNANANGVSQFKLRFASAADGAGSFGTSISYNPTFSLANNQTIRQSNLFDRVVNVR